MPYKGLVVALAAVVGTPLVAHAQVDVHVRLPLPSIRFEVAPPLVVVREGVQVVPDYPEEVFYQDSWYWHRSGTRWYRTRDHRGGWVLVERRYVPGMLVGIPAGKYKHHKHKAGKHHGHGNGHAKGNGHGKGHGGGKHKGKWK
jgi:hypothetical protein